jgi:hypothetical protein
MKHPVRHLPGGEQQEEVIRERTSDLDLTGMHLKELGQELGHLRWGDRRPSAPYNRDQGIAQNLLNVVNLRRARNHPQLEAWPTRWIPWLLRRDRQRRGQNVPRR